MTEEEASKFWCFRMTPAPGEDRTNPRLACIASKCAAWRQLSPLTADDGYCGLAGQPMRFAVNRGEDC